MKWKVTNEQEGLLLRDYLRNVQGFSRRIVKGIKFQGGSLLVNDVSVTVRKVLQESDIVEVRFPPENRSPFIVSERVPFTIVYEDNDVLVIEKPQGIATMPSIHHKSGTIANGILHHFEENGLDYTVHIVTRLDRDTSGLLLVGKHQLSHSILAQSQKKGEIDRRYQALIPGQLEKKKGTIDAPIARHPDSIIKRMVDTSGKHAVTHYQVIKEVKGYTLVQVKLETGRTHQIRVHFAYLGYPLMGDSLYGGSREVIKRQALHCTSLTFNHPITKQSYTFTSPLPTDMKKLIQEGTSI
ncbi:putative RNA pseudouridine synthase YjbO [Paraliobacillus quinghaiensis]|uniref:Pseudouridine synthase n=1 Tax=Paraliobacillus quinghaiensis TaxID=470815 RepID=A0A917TL13_9BACI|nr:RluA family pseudouridine synthase [Paraliobacillus quinghaiensis]GGM24746.1 putative RNA pseudouridine synthase YjbO [Paraliobacillus quinghaiensis]